MKKMRVELFEIKAEINALIDWLDVSFASDVMNEEIKV